MYRIYSITLYPSTRDEGKFICSNPYHPITYYIYSSVSRLQHLTCLDEQCCRPRRSIHQPAVNQKPQRPWRIDFRPIAATVQDGSYTVQCNAVQSSIPLTGRAKCGMTVLTLLPLQERAVGPSGRWWAVC